MIKVLVVEDEKLVRQGIISIMPWGKYGMEVVGEASNGRAALDFLAANPVDLLLTDLSMPGLSGLPYIEKVNEAFPALAIVVLTFHQEFDTIQSALRLGVIDYITKSQIDKQNTGEILSRISTTLGRRNTYLTSEKQFNQNFDFERAVVLYFPDQINFNIVQEYNQKLAGEFIRLDEKLVIMCNVSPEQIITAPGIVAIDVRHVKRISYNSICVILYTYINGGLFYDFLPNRPYYLIDVPKFIADVKDPVLHVEDVLDRLKKLKWVYNNGEYYQIICCIKENLFTNDQLRSLMYNSFVQWSYFIPLKVNEYFDEVKSLNWWYKWEEWLTRYRTLLRAVLNSSDAVDGFQLLEVAIEYINNTYSENIALEEILEKVHLSKSYFSQLFKQFTGKTFLDYRRDLRIEKAKQLLLETDISIVWIAEQVGYEDEKYFRKVFKDNVGLYPADFRRKQRNK